MLTLGPQRAPEQENLQNQALLSCNKSFYLKKRKAKTSSSLCLALTSKKKEHIVKHTHNRRRGTHGSFTYPIVHFRGCRSCVCPIEGGSLLVFPTFSESLQETAKAPLDRHISFCCHLLMVAVSHGSTSKHPVCESVPSVRRWRTFEKETPIDSRDQHNNVRSVRRAFTTPLSVKRFVYCHEQFASIYIICVYLYLHVGASERNCRGGGGGVKTGRGTSPTKKDEK